MNYLVNLILPKSGMQTSVRYYMQSLMAQGYSLHQVLGSLGGCSGRSCTISNGMITRI